MASFTREEISFFREQYGNNLTNNSRGLNQEGYLIAIRASIERANLRRFPDGQLIKDFNKARRDDTLSWPQFFQILQKIRNMGPPVEGEEGPPASGNESLHLTGLSEDVGTEPSRGIHRQQTLLRTMRRGMELVGNFFGVAGEEDPLWDDANRVESGGATLTLGRTGSVRRQYSRRDRNVLPTGPAEVIVSPMISSQEHGVEPSAPQSSFGMIDFGSSSSSETDSDTEDFFITPAPPAYGDVIEAPPPRPSSVPNAETSFGEDRGPALTIQRASAYIVTPEPMGVSNDAFEIPPELIEEVTRQPGRMSGDFIYDIDLAYRYYEDFVKSEKRALRRRAQQNAQSFFGGEEANSSAQNGAGGAGQSAAGGRRKRRKRRKLARQGTLVRQEVESLPTFFPFFTLTITITQIVACIVLLVLNGIAPINIRPQMVSLTVPSLAAENGTVTKTVMLSSNLWIGSRPVSLIQWGAKFKPCMRGDDAVTARNSRDTDNEAGPLGCCIGVNNTGTTVEEECFGQVTDCSNVTSCSINITQAIFVRGGSCISQGFGPTSTMDKRFFRPCCVSLTGACVVVSEEECTARKGIYHPKYDNCREINCLRNVCGFDGYGIPKQRPIAPVASTDPPPERPDQWWRWIIPIFLHLGIIQLIIFMAVQLYLGIKIERFAGWLRIGSIYILSGFGGLLFSAIFIPYEVYFGASGCVSGLLAVFLIEVLQTWKINDYAWLELIIFIVVIVILAFLGTLPYIDNFVSIGGFIFGLLSAMVFLPWVTFTKRTQNCRCIIIMIALPTLVILMILGLLVFYLLPDKQANFCTWCHYINCIPYFEGLCDVTNPSPNTENLQTVGL